MQPATVGWLLGAFAAKRGLLLLSSCSRRYCCGSTSQESWWPAATDKGVDMTMAEEMKQISVHVVGQMTDAHVDASRLMLAAAGGSITAVLWCQHVQGEHQLTDSWRPR
jgi:hypothetical protein